MMAPLIFMIGGVLVFGALFAVFVALMNWRERHHRQGRQP